MAGADMQQVASRNDGQPEAETLSAGLALASDLLNFMDGDAVVILVSCLLYACGMHGWANRNVGAFLQAPWKQGALQKTGPYP